MYVHIVAANINLFLFFLIFFYIEKNISKMLTNFDHMEMMTCQIAQTKRKCSSDELLNGSNNKEIIILEKIKSGCFV